jgi:hypothetical protein
MVGLYVTIVLIWRKVVYRFLTIMLKLDVLVSERATQQDAQIMAALGNGDLPLLKNA